MARLPRLVRLALTLDVGLVIAEGLLHPLGLPLGGNHCAQLGICVGVAVLVCELLDTADEDDEGDRRRRRAPVRIDRDRERRE